MRTLSRDHLRPRSAEQAMTPDLANSNSPALKQSNCVTKRLNTECEIHMRQGHRGLLWRYKTGVCSAPIAYWFRARSSLRKKRGDERARAEPRPSCGGVRFGQIVMSERCMAA